MRGLRWLFASLDLPFYAAASFCRVVSWCSYFSMVVCCWSCSGCIEDHDQEMMSLKKKDQGGEPSAPPPPPCRGAHWGGVGLVVGRPVRGTKTKVKEHHASDAFIPSGREGALLLSLVVRVRNKRRHDV